MFLPLLTRLILESGKETGICSKNIQVVKECHDGLVGGRLLQAVGAAVRGVAGTSLACPTG